jgi:8-oxo-dGTP diphosphatase
LITRRPNQVPQGGLWEFPGGKLETGEAVEQALERELFEELGIGVLASNPLIRVTHQYQDKGVVLDVHRVSAFSGTPAGCEGQPWRWVPPEHLSRYSFPAADIPIIGALCLPELYLITGQDPAQPDNFIKRLDQALSSGIKLVQLRAKGVSERHFARLAERAIDCCRSWGAKLLLNGTLPTTRMQADGVHLTARQLMHLSERPLDKQHLVAASCHNLAELVQAEQLGLDFVVLSPVHRTASHPQASAIGWDGFRELTEQVSIPIYALGGVLPAELNQARQYGGQGIAAIRALWPMGK